MVIRTRLQKAGEGTSLEKGRLPKTWIEVQLEKRINQKHLENLKKVGNAMKEVAKTGKWVIDEGSKALADTLSMKYYWEAMDSLSKPKEEQKVAKGLGFEKTYEKPLTTVTVMVKEKPKE